MAFAHNSEIVRLNNMRTMTDEELTAQVEASQDHLPFLKAAWENRHLTTKQYCFACFGEQYGSRAYFLHLRQKDAKGQRIKVPVLRLRNGSS